MPNVNKMRRRRSGTLNILRTAAKNLSIVFSGRYGFSAFLPTLGVLLRFNDRRSAAGFFNLFARALGKAVSGNAQRLRQLAVTQHHYIVLGFLDDSAIMQQLRRDLLIGLETTIQGSQTYFQPLLLKDVGKSALR